MFWRLLLKIGIDILQSLVVEFVLFAVRSFFVKRGNDRTVSVA
jgi:hypothetical protein